MDSLFLNYAKNRRNLSGIEKLNKLNSALSVARNLYSEEPYDEWIQKHLAGSNRPM